MANSFHLVKRIYFKNELVDPNKHNKTVFYLEIVSRRYCRKYFRFFTKQKTCATEGLGAQKVPKEKFGVFSLRIMPEQA